MSYEKSSTVLRKISGLLIVLSLLWAGPSYATSVFVDAGGPYEGEVGEEIELDAGASYILDGSEIGCYYWDWGGDGHWDECSSTPEVKHIWHSAFSGKVRVYIFYPDGVDWADARVTVTGPDTTLAVTLHSDADLHLFAPGEQHVGMNYDTGVYEMEIAGASLAFVSDPSASANPDGPELKTAPQIALPVYDGGPYEIELVGVADGSFTLSIQGLVDGVLHTEAVIEGHIYDEESITMGVTVEYKDGVLTLDQGKLTYCPELEVDPNDIEEVADPGEVCEVALTVRETEGIRPLRSVSLICSDLTNAIHTIKGSDIRFDRYNFDVGPGQEQVVHMSIPVPEPFHGEVTGSVAVWHLGEVVMDIPVAVKRAGLHGPTIEVVSPVYGIVGVPVEFDATGSNDMDGGIETYCWDWALNGKFECFDDPVCEHTWDSPFRGMVQLRVVDDEGHTATQYVSVMIIGSE